jgi:hypothetical protein
MPDWIGDQMPGVRPEATRVFGRNAQIAAIRLGARYRTESTQTGHDFEAEIEDSESTAADRGAAFVV